MSSKNFLYYLMPSAVSSLVGMLVVVPVSTYYLEPRDFGAIAILAAILAPLGPLSSAGGAWVLTGNWHIVEARERKTLLFNVLLVDLMMKLVWTIPLWFFAPQLLALLVEEFHPEYVAWFHLMLIAVFLSGFWPSISTLLVMEGRGSLHATLDLFQYLTGATTTVLCLVVWKLHTVSIVIGGLASATAIFLCCVMFAALHATPRVTLRWMREVLVHGLPSIPANLSEVIATMSDRYFIQKWVGLSELGMYAHSLQYRTAFVALSKAFSRTFAPEALRQYAKAESTAALAGMLRLWYSACAAGGVLVTLFSRDLVSLLTHDKFTAAAALVPVWFCFMFTIALGIPYLQYLLARKRSQDLATALIAATLAGIAVTAAGTWLLGATGAVLSMLLNNFGMQILIRRAAMRAGCPPVGERYFVCACAVLAATYVFAFWFDTPFLVRLGVGFVVASAILATLCVQRYAGGFHLVFPWRKVNT